MKRMDSSLMQEYALDMALGFVILLLAYGLKSLYSTAGSEELVWILRPTARLVEFFGRSEFLHQQGAGFISTDNRYLIAPACAGVNFLITAFCMSGFFGLRHFAGLPGKILYLCGCLAVSYCLTLLVNSLRIEVSITLFSAQVQWGWMNQERVHRLAGICIFFLALVAFHFLLRKVVRDWTSKGPQKMPSPNTHWLPVHEYTLSPYFWYLLIAVGVPLLNQRVEKGGLLFVEHCLTVIFVTLVVFLSGFLIKSACFTQNHAAGENGKEA